MASLVSAFASMALVSQIVFMLGIVLLTTVLLIFLRFVILEIKGFLKNKKFVTPLGTLTDDTADLNKSDKTKTEVSTVKVITPEVQFAILQAFQKMWDTNRTIKYSVILREQMDYAEDTIERMFNMTDHAFCAFMEINNISDYLLSIEYLSFSSFIELAKEKLIRKYRTMCKENHFTEKSNEDFREYLVTNAQLLTDYIKMLCKKHFQYRAELPNFNKELDKIYPVIKDALERCIEQARDIAIKKYDEIAEQKCIFMKKYEELTGMKVPIGFLDV